MRKIQERQCGKKQVGLKLKAKRIKIEIEFNFYQLSKML